MTNHQQLRSIQLTDFERVAIAERIEDLLDDTEDWGLDDQEYTEAIEFWASLVDKIELPERAQAIRERCLSEETVDPNARP